MRHFKFNESSVANTLHSKNCFTFNLNMNCKNNALSTVTT